MFSVQFFSFLKFNLILVLFIFISFIPLYAFSNSNLIQEVSINGEVGEIINNTVKINTSDNLSIVLYRISDTLNYKYQCKGEARDSAFITGSSNFISYTNFSEGIFQFKAGTSIQSDDEIHNQLPLVIEVNHSFLESWKFIQILLGYILLLVAGATYFIFLSNRRNKLKLFDLRNDWTNKLHNDIGGDLSSVALRINTLNRKLGKLDPVMEGKVRKILTLLNGIQKKLRFVFNLVDTKKDSLQVMLSDIKSFAVENFSLKQINFNFENRLQAEKMHEVNIGQINKTYLIMKEAINNAVKHSNASNVSIKITKIKEGISISIKDDGVGFDTAKQYDGNGINNLMEYGREGFIDIQIIAFPNKGTEIKIIIPEL